jgi:hypothetical protein
MERRRKRVSEEEDIEMGEEDCIVCACVCVCGRRR